MSKSVLVIYELVPEETKFFLIPESALSNALDSALVTAHGTFMNSVGLTDDQERAHQILLVATEEPTTIDRRATLENDAARLGVDPAMVGVLLPFEIRAKDLPFTGGEIDGVFFTGFML